MAWSETTIGEVLTLQRGFDITKVEQTEGRVPVISSGGVSSWHSEEMSSGPGVVIGRKGTLGKVFYSPGAYWPHDTTLWVCDFKGSYPRFVYYFLKTLDVSFLDVGSANPTLNRNHVHPIRVRWPDTGIQRAIAEVLGALDDKIGANVQITESCQRSLEGLFASLPKHRSMMLSSTAEFVNGRAFTKGASGTRRVVIRIAELNSGLGNSTVYSDAEVPDQHLARPGDLLFAWSGSLTLTRWFRPEGIVNQHIFKVIPKDGYPLWLVDQLLQAKLGDFKAIAADKATTMGHIQRHHLDAEVQVPEQDAIRDNDAVMCALWDRALAAEQESLALAALRDTLLPALMSGRVSVREAEASVGAVL